MHKLRIRFLKIKCPTVGRLANVPDTFFIHRMTSSIKKYIKSFIIFSQKIFIYLCENEIGKKELHYLFFSQVDGPAFRSILNYNLARFLYANMWHLTKYARFVETATTSSESKNTWEVINY